MLAVRQSVFAWGHPLSVLPLPSRLYCTSEYFLLGLQYGKNSYSSLYLKNTRLTVNINGIILFIYFQKSVCSTGEAAEDNQSVVKYSGQRMQPQGSSGIAGAVETRQRKGQPCCNLFEQKGQDAPPGHKKKFIPQRKSAIFFHLKPSFLRHERADGTRHG